MEDIKNKLDERKLNGLAHQYAYNELGSCPCEDCDNYVFDVSSLCRSHEPCEEATIYNEKYWKLVEDYKTKFNKR